MKGLFKFSIFLMTAIIMAATVSCEDEEKAEKKVPVTGISLNQTGSVTLAVSQTLVLTATVVPSDATNKDVVWTNDQFGIVIQIGGMITGLSPGTVTITATALDGGASASIEVTVSPVAISIFALNEKSIEIQPEETATLTYVIEPSNASNKTVTWSSNDPNVASVDPVTGEITGVSEGTAIITATAFGGLSDDCTVVVTTSIRAIGVSLAQSTLELVVGHTKTLEYEMIPDNATNANVTWRSSDSNIATVDEETGEITAIAPGTVTITVIADDGGHDDDCTVTVPENHIFNPGFELPEDPSVLPNQNINDANFGYLGWRQVMGTWFYAFYKDDPVGPGGDSGSAETGQGNPNRLHSSDNGWNGTGNFVFFADYRVGDWVGRCGQGTRQGVYQILTVTPGKTYEFSIIIGFGMNGDGNVIKDSELPTRHLKINLLPR